MAEIHAPGGPIPHVPDNLTVAQFILNSQRIGRVIPGIQANTSIIEDATGRVIHFDEIRQRTFALSSTLYARWKVEEDDVVCVCSPNHVDYPVAVWAVHRLGAIVTTANPANTSSELNHQLTMTRAKLLMVHPLSYHVAVSAARSAGISLERIILFDAAHDAISYPHPSIHELVVQGLSSPQSFVERQLKPGEGKHKLAFLSFSSGTTGKAKAVCIPHIAPIAAVIQLAHLIDSQCLPPEQRKIRVGDIWMALTPFYHIYGLVALMHFAIYYGAVLVVIPKFDFINMLKSIERYRVNVLPVVPPQVVLLCKHPHVKRYDLTSLRLILSGAAPLSAELTKQLSILLPWTSIGQGYGMTEVVGTISFPQMEQKIGTPGSAGRLIPGNIARVVRPDGKLAKFGEVGQLLIASPAVALGYLHNEEATKQTFVDGWVYTGDEVIINENAEVFILDRSKEILKVKGYQVAPAELEGHLLDHPDVSDVCVVGLPDEYSGELPLAFVVPSTAKLEHIKRDPAEAHRIKAALIKHVSDSKVHYKWLSGGVEFIDAIPKNPSGKLLRRVLREHAKHLQEKGQLTMRPKIKL